MNVKIKTPTIHPISVPATSSLRTYNFYLVENDNSLFLIDAGVNTEECWDAFGDVLQQNGFEIDDIDAIILTHNHSDHIGLVNRIRTVKNMPLYAHKDAVIRLKRDPQFMMQRAQFFECHYKEMGCGSEVNDLLERLKQSIERNKSQKIEGDIKTLVAGEEIFGFRVIEVPGHAPDHIALFHEESGILFVGDHIIEHSPSNALVELSKEGKRTASLIVYEQSLKKLLNMSVKVAYSGHGEVIHHPHKLTQKKLAIINKKATKIKNIVNKPKTAAEVAKQMYQTRYEPLLPLVMSEVVGHLDRLVHLGELTIEKHDGVFFYST